MRITRIYGLFAIVVLFLISMSSSHSYAEESESLQIEVKYTNGDRIDAYQTYFVIYQDNTKEPFLAKSLETNPENVVLPNNHKYKVEVYVNGMFGDVGYIQLKEKSEKLEINIPLPGGLKFNVFFDDGETPIDRATIIIKSHDGQEQRVGKTNNLGETMRYWLQSTNLPENYYIADVYFDEFLLTTASNVKVHQGIAQEQKIIVPIPPMVEELITFTLYDTESNEIMKNDGNFSIMLTDQDNTSFIESITGNKGEIYFSNIPSGVYSVSVLKENEKDPLWKEQKIIISGNKNNFQLTQTNPVVFSEEPVASLPEQTITSTNNTIPEMIIYEPTTKKYKISCQCISFRFDDVQDYWLNNVQVDLIKVFSENNVPLTVGIIANSFGEDPKITNEIQGQLKNNKIIIANHGLDSTPFTLFDKNKQDSMLKQSQDKIFEELSTTPTIFIPPQNRFNEDTKTMLIENGFTHLSASLLNDSKPFPLKDQTLYRFPELATTGEYVPSQNRILGISAEKTFSDAIQAMEENGFAVITVHPQEFAVFQGGEYLNEVNSNQLKELVSLITKIKNNDIQMVHLDKINSKIKILPSNDKNVITESNIPNWIKNNAGWWRDGHIDDDSFIYGIEFLINKGILKIPPTTQGSGQSEIPSWVKENAGWWAENRISDDDFIYGVNYLVSQGIIVMEM